MIKVGMNLLLWSDDAKYDRHKGLLDFCKGVGFDGVEFNVGIVSDPSECEKFGAYARDLGLDVTTVGTFDPGVCNPVSPDADLRAAGLSPVSQIHRLDNPPGGKLICGPLHQGLGYFSGARPTQQEWDWSIETMRPCFEYARDHGITVAVEPLNRFESYLFNTVAEAVRYVKEIDLDNVGLLVDTMHSNIEELGHRPRLPRGAALHPPRHISENDRGIPGTGHACRARSSTSSARAATRATSPFEAFNLGAPSLTGALHLWRTFAPSDDDLARQGHDYIRRMLRA